MTEWVQSDDNDQVLTDGEFTIQIVEHGLRLYRNKNLLYAATSKDIAAAKKFADVYRKKK